ncbi:MAG: HAMP domain-containing histidine kinase, partial [Muribaculaceae bacterium]|nr:HAMP domain-containing histidine kinase [Muribaculaceae bacterium]
HELKTPIAAAYSANDTLLNYGKHHDAEKRERYLRLAIEQLTRLSKLVENILSMSMERRRNFTLAREKTAVKPLLSEIADIQTLKADKPVEIDVDVVPENLEIDCDPVHFGNVINNLLDNAIKYSGETVHIKMRADSGSISVSDNGIGIPHKALPMIFNKFYRVPTGKRQDVRGYGIGLYYVHSIVEKHGWKISAVSSPGKGSVFTIRLKDDEK